MSKKKKKKDKSLKYAIFAPLRPALRFLLKRKGISTNRQTKTRDLVQMFIRAYSIEIKNFEQYESFEYYDESGERITLSEYASLENLTDDMILAAAKQIIKIIKDLISKFKNDKKAEKELKEIEEDDDIEKNKKTKKREKETTKTSTNTIVFASIAAVLLISILIFAIRK